MNRETASLPATDVIRLGNLFMATTIIRLNNSFCLFDLFADLKIRDSKNLQLEAVANKICWLSLDIHWNVKFYAL